MAPDRLNGVALWPKCMMVASDGRQEGVFVCERCGVDLMCGESFILVLSLALTTLFYVTYSKVKDISNQHRPSRSSSFRPARVELPKHDVASKIL